MALMITDECINCGVCEPECPNEAIQMGEEIFFIRAGKCTECVGSHDKPQCVELCPIEQCIIPNPRRIETREALLEKHERLTIRRKVTKAIKDSGL
ncbi:MAG: YfhL family 4Fe-4S dicluster ferredoxin [Sutterella sp.]|nr:YfhL family 4Fe-4S dicluster ferredoxin [Sutterella sp.]